MNLVYGALNDVIAKLKDKEYEESKLVYDTSLYLQKNMKAAVSSDVVPFTDELAYIRAYAKNIRSLNL